jgi:hypothetical protein
MSRVDSDNESVLAILVRKMLCDTLSVAERIVYANEGRRNVGLLV